MTCDHDAQGQPAARSIAGDPTQRAEEDPLANGMGVRALAIRLLALLAVIAAASLVAQQLLDVSANDIEEAVDRAGILAPIAYATILFLGLSVPLNPVSDLATVNVAALVFRPEVSVLATFVAHSMALAANYLVARRYGPVLLDRFAPRSGAAAFERIGRGFSYRTVFALRFALPLTAVGIDFVSYIAGARRLRFARFYIVSIIPWTMLSVVYFYSTAYLLDRSLLFFFVPSVILILGPSGVVLLLRRRRTTSRAD